MDIINNHKRVLLTIPEWDFNVTNNKTTNNGTGSSKTTGGYDTTTIAQQQPLSSVINKNNSTDCCCSDNEHVDNTSTDFLDDLVLLQLPPNWTVSDLISDNNNNITTASSTNDNVNSESNKSGTYFIGGKKHSSTPSASASSLVLNHKNTSFDVFRVETSNALVMIPPKQLSSTASTTTTTSTISPSNKRKSLEQQQQNNGNDDDDNKSDIENQSTINNGNNTENEIITTRLIKRGGSGAYYLELRVRRIHPYQHVQTLLPIWNPYTTSISSLFLESNSTPTTTVQQLAITLQVSIYQVNTALQTIGAFPISIGNNDQNNQEYCYVLLDDEILFNVYNSIVYTLAEVGYDYAIDDIVVDTFIDEVLQRMSYEEKQLFISYSTNNNHNNINDNINDNVTMIKSIVQFCVYQLTDSTCVTTSTTETTNADVARFSVSKVAAFVAKRIFIYDKSNIQDNDEEYFLQKWQADMPGVGVLYQVSTTMLRGIAIQTTISSLTNVNTKTNTTTTTTGTSKSSNKLVWKYFPKESIVPIHSNTNNSSQHQQIIQTVDEQLQKCMDVLFTAKEYWLLEELLPYLERIIHIKADNNDDSSANSNSNNNNSDDATSILSNTLVRYTKVISKDGYQYYQKK